MCLQAGLTRPIMSYDPYFKTQNSFNHIYDPTRVEKKNSDHTPSLSRLEYARALKKQASPLQRGKAPILRTNL